MSELLEKARSYEAKKIAATDKESKPLFHISAPAGWINDPNGFSVYNGKIHLFYQYYPYRLSYYAPNAYPCTDTSPVKTCCSPASVRTTKRPSASTSTASPAP